MRLLSLFLSLIFLSVSSIASEGCLTLSELKKNVESANQSAAYWSAVEADVKAIIQQNRLSNNGGAELILSELIHKSSRAATAAARAQIQYSKEVMSGSCK